MDVPAKPLPPNTTTRGSSEAIASQEYEFTEMQDEHEHKCRSEASRGRDDVFFSELIRIIVHGLLNSSPIIHLTCWISFHPPHSPHRHTPVTGL